MNYKKNFKDETIKKINSENIDFPDFTKSLDGVEVKPKKKMKTWKKITIISTSLAVLLPACFISAIIISIGVKTVYSTKPLSQNFTKNDFETIESNSFKYLNTITFPNGEKEIHKISDSYNLAVNTFAYNIYKNLDEVGSNFSFSPVALYTNLSICYLACSDSSSRTIIENILGSNDAESRAINYQNCYKNDFYINDGGTTQMYNGSFQSNTFGNVNQSYIDSLNNYYCEAFSLDFNNEEHIQLMVDWINSRSGNSNFLKKGELEISSNSALFLFNLITFKNKWASTFSNASTRKDTFYISKTDSVVCDFMNHMYSGDYYKYDSYYSFYDYYKNGMKIKYLIPASTEDDIFLQTKDKNIFVDDETKLIEDKIIQLAVPKFTSSSTIDFESCLNKLGASRLYDESINSFSNPFIESTNNVYLDVCKQKNKIEFSEDGTTFSSLTWSGLGAGAAEPNEANLNVQLNQPFIYIIYDDNDLPLYVGNVVDPTK